MKFYNLPYNANDTPAHSWGSFNIEKLMQPLLLLPFPEATQHKVKDTVQKNGNQNEHVTIVFGLVYRDDEAVSFHDQRQHEQGSHHAHHASLRKLDRLKDEIGHLLLDRTVLIDGGVPDCTLH